MTSKARAELRAEANKLQAIIQVGKSGVEDNLIKQVDDALEARELIKIKALDTCPEDAKTVAAGLAEVTGADVIQVVGRTIVLWRKKRNG
ncbi:MAG: ribosome assembly RNA-binding protein YhbY [Clostridia bacterium]|nr:ribosome assembly RNA-binding protein YhbY [Clostridia bacterium]